jgi:hypothetical protein
MNSLPDPGAAHMASEMHQLRHRAWRRPSAPSFSQIVWKRLCARASALFQVIDFKGEISYAQIYGSMAD